MSSYSSLLALSKQYLKLAQQVPLGGSHKLTFQESNEYAVIALNRLFPGLSPTEIADWIQPPNTKSNPNRPLLDAPKQFFTKAPILFEVGKDYVAFLVSDDKVLRVGFLEDKSADHNGKLMPFKGQDIFWSIVPKQKPNSTNITPETEKAIRFVVRDIVFELTGPKKQDLDAVKKSGNADALAKALVDTVTKDFPNGIEEIEASILINADWLDNLCRQFIGRGVAGKIDPQMANATSLKIKVDNGYIKIL